MFLLFRKNRILLFSLLIAIFFLIGYYHNELIRYTSYFRTVFDPLHDHSFTSRFDFWKVVLSIMNDYPISYLLGFPNYKEVLLSKQHHTIIDSNYLYLLLKLGLGGCFLFILFIINTVQKNIYTIYFFIFLFITWITLAFFDDYRLAFLTGILLGVIDINEFVISEKHEKSLSSDECTP